MNIDFLSVLATDRVTLPALLYQPPKPTKKAAVWLHGMGDSGVFYKPELMNSLGQALTQEDIAFLAFNNRGAHNTKRLSIADDSLPEEDRQLQAGTYYEQISDCIKDIEGAAGLLTKQGFTELYLLGHSTGANKICAYNNLQPLNRFSKYVLAGPGDDTGMLFKSFGAKRFWSALQYAAKNATTTPERIMPKYTGMHPFSTQAALDILNPDGQYNTFPYYEASVERIGNKPLFEEYCKIDKPCLVVIGADDEYIHSGTSDEVMQLFLKHTSNSQLKQADFGTIPDADHSFHGHESEFAKYVADWLVK